MPLSLNFVLETIASNLCESTFGAVSTGAFDSPLTIVTYEAHFAARSPRMINLSRESKPGSFFAA